MMPPIDQPVNVTNSVVNLEVMSCVFERHNNQMTEVISIQRQWWSRWYSRYWLMRPTSIINCNTPANALLSPSGYRFSDLLS